MIRVHVCHPKLVLIFPLKRNIQNPNFLLSPSLGCVVVNRINAKEGSIPWRPGEEQLQGATASASRSLKMLFLPAIEHADVLKRKKEKEGGITLSDVK